MCFKLRSKRQLIELSKALTRMPNPSSYAINCVFFAIYLNSMVAWLDNVTVALIGLAIIVLMI